jgi:hypothetical protein
MNIAAIVLELEKNNDVTVLTLPPHSTNELQPQDIEILVYLNLSKHPTVLLLTTG